MYWEHFQAKRPECKNSTKNQLLDLNESFSIYKIKDKIFIEISISNSFFHMITLLSSNGDTGVLQLAPYLFIICLHYVLQMSIDLMKENSFILKKATCKRHPAETIMDADYLALFEAGSKWHSPLCELR